MRVGLKTIYNITCDYCDRTRGRLHYFSTGSDPPLFSARKFYQQSLPFFDRLGRIATPTPVVSTGRRQSILDQTKKKKKKKPPKKKIHIPQRKIPSPARYAWVFDFGFGGRSPFGFMACKREVGPGGTGRGRQAGLAAVVAAHFVGKNRRVQPLRLWSPPRNRLDRGMPSRGCR